MNDEGIKVFDGHINSLGYIEMDLKIRKQIIQDIVQIRKVKEDVKSRLRKPEKTYNLEY